MVSSEHVVNLFVSNENLYYGLLDLEMLLGIDVRLILNINNIVHTKSLIPNGRADVNLGPNFKIE